jgi:Uma2 family endonuclease
MGTKALISPEQYLATHYEREPEYVRGEIRQKPMPDRIHSWIAGLLIELLRSASRRISAEPEVRCRIAADVYRLPDVAVFFRDEPIVQVPENPPLAAIEVVSKDERHVELIEKLRDYEYWGVPRIWVVDPWTKTLAEWRNGALLPIDALALPEHGFEVRLQQLIEGLPL